MVSNSRGRREDDNQDDFLPEIAIFLEIRIPSFFRKPNDFLLPFPNFKKAGFEGSSQFALQFRINEITKEKDSENSLKNCSNSIQRMKIFLFERDFIRRSIFFFSRRKRLLRSRLTEWPRRFSPDRLYQLTRTALTSTPNGQLALPINPSSHKIRADVINLNSEPGN